MTLRILDVGQCGFDGPAIQQALKGELHARVDRADTADETKRQLASAKYDIVLINRELNADGSSGIDLIADLAQSGVTVPLMLVSDRVDAQVLAVAIGGVRGFGKSQLHDPATFDLIKKSARHNN